MIERRDFLMLQIEQIGQLIAKIRGLQHPGDEREAYMQFRQCFEVLRIREEELAALPPEELIRRIGAVELLMQFAQLLTLYLRDRASEPVARLRDAVERHLRDKGVLRIEDYL